ncbi:MAG: hypothetical protein HZA00_02290 [Nitrospinae bacterium]|nr:hypothetical protein [Nitrospinota bacterium]
MFVYRTVIGRELYEDNKTESDKDAVLYQLYQFHYNIFNPKDVPMSLKKLSHSVRLSEKRIKDICEMLADDKLIKSIILSHAIFYKITGRGVQFVEKYLNITTQEPVSAAYK